MIGRKSSPRLAEREKANAYLGSETASVRKGSSIAITKPFLLLDLRIGNKKDPRMK